jgi:hypothetical protein
MADLKNGIFMRHRGVKAIGFLGINKTNAIHQ